jgi:DNA-binding response OmpR family regulator
MSYILLVEDNKDHADLTLRTLRAAGYEVQHTQFGLDALSISRGQRPDLILMDFALPDIDGRSIILLLRQLFGERNTPPIVAITARSSEADVRLSKRIGCAAFVSKPFLPEELVVLVKQLLNTANTSERAEQ